MGHCQYKSACKCYNIVIALPELEPEYGDPKLREQPTDIHVDMTKNYIVVMRRNGTILKIPSQQLTDSDSSENFVLDWSPVKLPISSFYDNKYEVDEIGLKWMFVNDLV